MTTAKHLSILLTFATTAILACDGSDSAPTAALGLGDAPIMIHELAASDAAAPTASAHGPAGLAAPAGPEATPLSASNGLPARDKDVIGWLEWSGALPYTTGPIFDQTGEQCGEGQSGKTWYLPGTAGGPVERDCTISKSTKLVFPLLNYYSAVPDHYFDTPEDRQTYVDNFAATSEIVQDFTCTLHATLDGVPLYGGELGQTWRAVLEPFDVTLPDDPDHFAAFFGTPAGETVGAVSVGYYARLGPLKKGDHVLEFGGSLCTEGEILFETAATYNLHVE